MENLLNKIKSEIEIEIKSFGITEIFYVDGELHTTSNYALTENVLNKIKNIQA